MVTEIDINDKLKELAKFADESAAVSNLEEKKENISNMLFHLYRMIATNGKVDFLIIVIFRFMVL